MAAPDSTARVPHTRVGIVTVSYGSGDALEVFLHSLREFHGDAMAVAVVDNKPDHENVQELAANSGSMYLPLPTNPGYGAGMNAGARALANSNRGREFDAYFFCNPDVRFLEPTIDALASSLMLDPLAGSVAPRVLNEDGTVYPSARNIPSLSTGIGHALLSKVWPQNPWSRRYQDAANYSARRNAGSLSGAAVMVKKKVFDQLEGWDEDYFMHFEDIDLGWRIGNLGLTNVYEPAVSVEHSGAHSTKKHAVTVERAMTDSAIRFMKKRYPGFWNAPLRWGITVGLRLRGYVRLRRTGPNS
ncbi:dTDP-Rha--alpha-D-GlcNAc-pyrophosphate polyprenol alpha-3-L-rhamnosyltransferase [Leucobacter sp. W1478]|uniref:dTDP-Rha--alpha-D-GlcNAc-pyrophosphate polyprenol alpha-3-L-rhamnosyltransferase n=1 Tax=Leucobacter sp. W1478 TaxID=3439065 RepID=UPI003F32800D